jgi:hypothetical protein
MGSSHSTMTAAVDAAIGVSLSATETSQTQSVQQQANMQTGNVSKTQSDLKNKELNW